jgi:PadR family transcriptional regulator PadR
MNQYKTEHIKNVEKLTEVLRKGIVQRITKNLLDVQILRLIKTQPMWGYKIKQQVEADYGVRLRHGALYPLLNKMEKEGFMISHKEPKGGRIRKTYEITKKGLQLVNTYNEVLTEQIQA